MLFLQNLKDVLADLIPKEQSRIKNFKQQYGKTNIGQITVDMVSDSWANGQENRIIVCAKRAQYIASSKLLLNLGRSMLAELDVD